MRQPRRPELNATMLWEPLLDAAAGRRRDESDWPAERPERCDDLAAGLPAERGWSVRRRLRRAPPPAVEAERFGAPAVVAGTDGTSAPGSERSPGANSRSTG